MDDTGIYNTLICHLLFLTVTRLLLRSSHRRSLRSLGAQVSAQRFYDHEIHISVSSFLVLYGGVVMPCALIRIIHSGSLLHENDSTGVESPRSTQFAFILNMGEHWFTLRRFGPALANIDNDAGKGHWFNLNSFLSAPEWVGKLYLGMVLQQAETEGALQKCMSR